MTTVPSDYEGALTFVSRSLISLRINATLYRWLQPRAELETYKIKYGKVDSSRCLTCNTD